MSGRVSGVIDARDDEGLPLEPPAGGMGMEREMVGVRSAT
jgi:hypothetical protein